MPERRAKAGPNRRWKRAGTFCGYFEFARRVWTPNATGNSREAPAREHLKKAWRLRRLMG
jgi:hypothetical protein